MCLRTKIQGAEGPLRIKKGDRVVYRFWWRGRYSSTERVGNVALVRWVNRDNEVVAIINGAQIPYKDIISVLR